MMKLSTCAPAVGGIWTVRVIEKLLAELKILKGGAIGLLGLASKPRRIISGRRRPLQSPVNLRNAVSRWQAQDPVALARARRELPDAGIAFCEDAGQVVKGEGALVPATEWPRYRDLPWEPLAGQMCNPGVLDSRHFRRAARHPCRL
jgi:UDP-glucose 6-dehydrogenase